MIRRWVWAGFLALVFLAPAGADPTFPSRQLSGLRVAPASPPLHRDPALDALCADRAAALAASGTLAHGDGSGRGPGLQSVAAGYPPGEFGEVLGAGSSEEAVWEAWMASPPHREVLTSPGWTRWGAGSAPAGAGRVWVVRFWRP